MTTPEQSTATSNPNEGVVPLDKPIVRGANTIDSLTLRKPASGELRGVSPARTDADGRTGAQQGPAAHHLPEPDAPGSQRDGPGRPDGVRRHGVRFLLQKSAKEASLFA